MGHSWESSGICAGPAPDQSTARHESGPSVRRGCERSVSRNSSDMFAFTSSGRVQFLFVPQHFRGLRLRGL